MVESLDYSWTVRPSERPFFFTPKLVITAGPCTVSPRILKALGEPVVAGDDEDFLKAMSNIKKMLKYIFQTQNEMTFVHQTAGHGANESMVCNLTEPGDTVIIAIKGTWGERLLGILKRYDLNIITLHAPLGEVFSTEELEEAIKKHRPTTLFIVHGETSTGVLQPLEGLGDICHKYSCLLAVDAVVSLAAEPLFVDKWKLDAVSSGTQKAIGCIPGLSLATFSPLAKQRMIARKTPVTPYFLDALCLNKSWAQFDGKGEPHYHYTLNTGMYAALHEAMATICEEGLENSWKRHKECAELLWQKAEEIGQRNLIEKVENRFHGVSIISLPEDVPIAQFLEHLRQKYAVDTAYGIGPTAGNNVRVGFLGYNARPEVVEYFAEIMKETIEYLREHPNFYDTKLF